MSSPADAIFFPIGKYDIIPLRLVNKQLMKKAILIIIVALVVIGGGIALFAYDAKHPELKDPWGNKSTRDLALSCLPQEYTDQHIHPQLTIKINGAQQTIPANIGIQGVSGDTSMQQAQTAASCLHPLHTHDSAGTIHVESPEARDYTVGDFFAVWGKVFTKDQILDSKVDDTHKIVMTVNGKEDEDFENYVMHDKDQIVISYESK